MRFEYWTIRAVPRPMGITTIGVGVIVANPETDEYTIRWRIDRDYLRGTEHADAIRHTCEDLENLLTRTFPQRPTLELNSHLTFSGFVHTLSRDWSTLVRIDPARTVSAGTLQVAADLLFEALIGSASRKVVGRTVKTLRSAVRSIYDSQPILRELTTYHPVVHVAHRKVDVNLSVSDATNVYEINQAFNFQTTDTQLPASIDAWTLKIEKLRSEGGLLEIKGKDQLEVTPEIDVVAVVYPPAENHRHAVEYSDFRMFCDDLDVAILHDSQVPDHAESLGKRLAAM